MLFRRQIILLILLTSISSYAYAEWNPNLEPSSGQTWSSSADSYRIYIDPSVSDSRLQNLSLEVDNIDVTPTVELVDDKEVTYTDVVDCTTCHNPHFGFLVAVKGEEELQENLVARESGDALLRLKDHDNALCQVCH